MNIRHKRKEKEESVSTARELFQWVAAIVAAVLIALAIDNFVIVNAQIPSGSMENTIMTGDRIFGFRMAYGINFDFFGTHVSKKMKDPERYDIIIFKYPDDESQLFIKRLIGLPGDTVEIKNGKVFINGEEDEEANSHVPETPTGNYGPYVVPEGCYFMLGDNREHSKDSRFWSNTFVTYDEIVGKAIVRYYPSIKVLE